VGGGVLIQITPQMRILVAIESIDGRKYAPSTVMRSFAKPGLRDSSLLHWKPFSSHVELRIT
jgi:hypothetical protein